MFSKKLTLAAMLCVALVAISSSAFGQLIFGQQNTAQTQFMYTHWKLDIGGQSTTVGQSLVPISGLVPLKENFEIRFFAASEFNSVSRTGTDLSVSGLTDVSLQVNHSFSNDHLLLSGGLNLPTGKRELDVATEWPILGYLAQNYLVFPMREYGEGFGFNLLAGGATMVGSIRCGLGVSYQYTGKYTPYKNAGKYNPGDRFSINGGGDYRSGGFSLSGNVLFGIYGTDKIDDKRVFKQSPQTGLSLSGGYEQEKYAFSAGLGLLLRGRNTEYDPASDSLLSQLRLYGNEFNANASLLWRLSPRWRVSPMLGLKHIAANESNLGTANLYSFGTGIGLKLSNTFDLDTGFKYYTGNADSGAIDLTGYQISAALGASW